MMKPGLRKVAALILASAMLFGSDASAVSAASADDTTMGTSTRIQAEPDVKTTTGGDEAATKPDPGSGDEAGTGADKQSDTGAPAQSAPQADAGQAAPDVTVTVGDDLQGNLTAKVEYDPTDDSEKDSGAMPATPTDKADKTKGDAVGDKPSTTPGMVTVTGTRPEFNNSYIPPVTPAIVKTIRQLAKTGVSAPIVALTAFTLLGVGLMLFRRRGNQTETARHRK